MWSLRREGLIEFLDNRSPWNTVCGHCFTEASAAGLVEPELTSAVMGDCLRTVADAYSPDLGD